jgi:hypothetical protein
MHEIWTVADVKRAYREHVQRVQREHPGYTEEEQIQDARAEVGYVDRLALPPNTRLLISERAVSGTAEDQAEYTGLLEHPGRVAPVLRVPAGYRATAECSRYVTLVESKY